MPGPLNTIGIAANTGLRAVERYEVLQDEVRTNTGALAASGQLVAQIAAGETLIWQCVLVFGGNSAGNAKFAFQTPAAPASGGLYGQGTTAAGAQYSISGALALYNAAVSTADASGATSEWLQIYWGRLVNGTTPGEFAVQWAQNAANATPSKLLIGSFLEVWRR